VKLIEYGKMDAEHVHLIDHERISGMADSRTIEPVPGDPSTEPVATGAQSHVAGRVGPPSFAQDSANFYAQDQGVDQIDPGEIKPAETPITGPIVPEPEQDKREATYVSGGETDGNVETKLVTHEEGAEPIAPNSNPSSATVVETKDADAGHTTPSTDPKAPRGGKVSNSKGE
jgi:hypothetical protein